MATVEDVALLIGKASQRDVLRRHGVFRTFFDERIYMVECGEWTIRLRTLLAKRFGKNWLKLVIDGELAADLQPVEERVFIAFRKWCAQKWRRKVTLEDFQ